MEMLAIWAAVAGIWTAAKGIWTVSDKLDTVRRLLEEQNSTMEFFIRDWREKNGPWHEPHPFDEL